MKGENENEKWMEEKEEWERIVKVFIMCVKRVLAYRGAMKHSPSLDLDAGEEIVHSLLCCMLHSITSEPRPFPYTCSVQSCLHILGATSYWPE